MILSNWKWKRRHIADIAILLGLLVTTGCLTAPEIERTRQYILNPQIELESVAPINLTLGIRPLFSARPYGLPMAYLDNDQQLVFRSRDEWAEPPADSITRALTDALVATKRFKDVGNASDMARPDLLLTGELRKFHENRNVTPPVAELEVRIELRLSRDPGIVWAGTLEAKIHMDSEEAGAFAAAMNEAVGKIAVRAAEAIAAAEPPQTALSEIPVLNTATGIAP